MSEIAARNVLLLVGMGALVLTAAILPAISTEALAKAHAVTTTSTHHYSVRDWKRRHRVHKVSRRLVRPRSYAPVYVPRSYPWPPINYETELLLDCLMTQPFVICP